MSNPIPYYVIKYSSLIINSPSCPIQYLTTLSNIHPSLSTIHPVQSNTLLRYQIFIPHYQLSILSNPILYHVIKYSSLIINSPSCPIQYLTTLSNIHPSLSTLHPVQSNTLLRYQIFIPHYQLSILSNPIPYYVIKYSSLIINSPSCPIQYFTTLSNIHPSLSTLHPVQSNTLLRYEIFISHYQLSILSNPIPYYVIKYSSLINNSPSCPFQYLTTLSNIHPSLSTIHPVQSNTLLLYQIFIIHYQLYILSNPIPYYVIKYSSLIINYPSCPFQYLTTLSNIYPSLSTFHPVQSNTLLRYQIFIPHYQLSILSNPIPYYVIKYSSFIINSPSCPIQYLTTLSNIHPSLSTLHPVQSNTLPRYQIFIPHYQLSILSNPIPYYVIKYSSLINNSPSCPFQYLTTLSNIHPSLSTIHPVHLNTLLRYQIFILHYQLSILSNPIPYYVIKYSSLIINYPSCPIQYLTTLLNIHPSLSTLHLVQSNTLLRYQIFIPHYQLSILSNPIPYYVIKYSSLIINSPSCPIQYLTTLSNIHPSLSTLHLVQSNTLLRYQIFIPHYQLSILSNQIPYHVIKYSSLIINYPSCPFQYLTTLSNIHPSLSTIHPVHSNTLLRYQIFIPHYQLSILSNPIPYHVIKYSSLIINYPSCPIQYLTTLSNIHPSLSTLHPVHSNTLLRYQIFILYYQLSILSIPIPYYVIKYSSLIINYPSCPFQYLTTLSNIHPSLSTLHPVQSNTLPHYQIFIPHYQLSILSNPIPYHVIKYSSLIINSPSCPIQYLTTLSNIHPSLSTIHPVHSNTLLRYQIFILYYQLSILSIPIPYYVIKYSSLIINYPSCPFQYLTTLSNIHPSLSTLHPVQSNTLPHYQIFIPHYQLSILSNPIPYHVIKYSSLIINSPYCPIQYLTTLSNIHPLLTLHLVQSNTLLRYQIFIPHYQLSILSNPIPYYVIKYSSLIINSPSCPIQYLTTLSNIHPSLSTIHPVQSNTLLRYQIFIPHYQLSILSNPIPYHVIKYSSLIINSPSCPIL